MDISLYIAFQFLLFFTSSIAEIRQLNSIPQTLLENGRFSEELVNSTFTPSRKDLTASSSHFYPSYGPPSLTFDLSAGSGYSGFPNGIHLDGKGILYPQVPHTYVPPFPTVGPPPIKPHLSNFQPLTFFPPPPPQLPSSTGFGFPYHHYFHHYQNQFILPPPTKPTSYLDPFNIATLPNQLRVPGDMKLRFVGRNVEIICEFPKYLILMQGIYWHHKQENSDPFGSYFDTQNGFGNHVTVKYVNQWESILVIQDYEAYDYGTYRCISAAVLPAEAKYPQVTGVPQPPISIANPPSPPIPATTLPSSPSPGSTLKYHPNIPSIHSTSFNSMTTLPSFPYELGSGTKEFLSEIHPLNESDIQDKTPRKSLRYAENTRKMKFPPIPEKAQMMKRQLALDTKGWEPIRNEDNEPLYTLQSLPFPYRLSEPQRLTNPLVPVDKTDFPLSQAHSHLPNSFQHERTLPSHFQFSGYQFGYPTIPPPAPYFPGNPGTPLNSGFGLKVPYYIPQFAYYTVYQEIDFQGENRGRFSLLPNFYSFRGRRNYNR